MEVEITYPRDSEHHDRTGDPLSHSLKGREDVLEPQTFHWAPSLGVQREHGNMRLALPGPLGLSSIAWKPVGGISWRETGDK